MTNTSGALGYVVPPPSTVQIQQFDFSVNLLQALLWQYNDATKLQSVLQQKQNWYDDNQTQFWQDWYTNVFNIETANQFGLAVWDIILGIKLYVNSPPSADPRWGFADEDVNFGFGNMEPIGGAFYQLPLEIQRIAIKLRYGQLIGSGTVPETNRLLKNVFSSMGQAYLVDNHNMTQTYVFNFPLSVDLLFLFNNYDILPRPAAVKSSFDSGLDKYWGFADEDTNFYDGVFYGGS